MALLTIYRDTRAPGRCRSCGADVEWAELTTSGKRTPFDRIVPVQQPQQANLIVMNPPRVIDVVNTDTSPVHFQTCPDAKDWRRR
jgi:hypothetical protein